MEQVQKIYVEVDAHFDRLGHLYPRAIHWKQKQVPLRGGLLF